MNETNLGHAIIGDGELRVVVLNDWLCAVSTWDAARAYIDASRFTWAFTDLRGYGRSRAREGRYDLAEASADVLGLADALGWSTFAMVGHSMSTLVAIDVAQHQPDRVARVVLITPPPPTGFGADDAAAEASRALACASDEDRARAMAPRFADRLARGWGTFKLARWRETARPEAAAAYVAMFARDGVPDRTTRIRSPVLAITGEEDIPFMRSEAVTKSLGPFCEKLEVVALTQCGHYPMQEMPPRTVGIVERFLSSDA